MAWRCLRFGFWTSRPRNPWSRSERRERSPGSSSGRQALYRAGPACQARRRLEAPQVAPAVHNGDRGDQFGPAGASARGLGRDPCDRADLPRRSRDTPSLSAPNSQTLRSIFSSTVRVGLPLVRGAGQDAINRLACKSRAGSRRWIHWERRGSPKRTQRASHSSGPNRPAEVETLVTSRSRG